MKEVMASQPKCSGSGATIPIKYDPRLKKFMRENSTALIAPLFSSGTYSCMICLSTKSYDHNPSLGTRLFYRSDHQKKNQGHLEIASSARNAHVAVYAEAHPSSNKDGSWGMKKATRERRRQAC